MVERVGFAALGQVCVCIGAGIVFYKQPLEPSGAFGRASGRSAKANRLDDHRGADFGAGIFLRSVIFFSLQKFMQKNLTVPNLIDKEKLFQLDSA